MSLWFDETKLSYLVLMLCSSFSKKQVVAASRCWYVFMRELMSDEDLSKQILKVNYLSLRPLVCSKQSACQILKYLKSPVRHIKQFL